MDGAAVAADANHTAAASTGAKDEPRPAHTRDSTLVEEAARVAVTLNEKLPPLSEESPARTSQTAAPEREREPRSPGETAAGAHASQPPRLEGSVAEPAAGRPAQAAETRGRVGRRAATVGASVGENLRPRVEKLREASTVVFDEASDDPGLRFVIVAALLFIIFLFIFLFSYILG